MFPSHFYEDSFLCMLSMRLIQSSKMKRMIESNDNKTTLLLSQILKNVVLKHSFHRTLQQRSLFTWLKKVDCRTLYENKMEMLNKKTDKIRELKKDLVDYKKLYEENLKTLSEKNEKIGELKSELKLYMRCIAMYNIRMRIELEEMKYMQLANYSDDELRQILSIDKAKLDALSAKLMHIFESTDKDQIVLNRTVVQSEMSNSEEDYFRGLSSQKATRHYLRWRYIFVKSKQIEFVRQGKTEDDIHQICTDISSLWILSCPVHHIPIPGLIIEKEDACIAFKALQFKSRYSEDILNLLF